ncbi:MAG: homoserine dehydrogenase [Nocardioidaceae bacterium]
MTRTVRVALLGCGVVGTEVARLLGTRAADLAERVGAPVELAGIAVRRIERPRATDLPAELFTTDAEGLVARPDVDVVVEVIGGIEPARSLILAALDAGASVVTANKALLAEDGGTLFAAAEKAERDLYFEAAVAGAIPIIRPLRESLAGDTVRRLIGIVNGTTNYILDTMERDAVSFTSALEKAQELGYSEADPTADVEGFDAAAKAAILASLAFHTRVSASDVHREGITGVDLRDLRSARQLGCVLKALAICERSVDECGSTTVSVRVHPAMIPTSHPLASVGGAFNAVVVDCEAAGQLMFYGPGAGGPPTASAVLGDLVTVARQRLSGVVGAGESTYADCTVSAMETVSTRYHIVLDVADEPGVLAAVARLFADESVSIEKVQQDGRGDEARLVVVTHAAPDAVLRRTVTSLAALDAVHAVSSVLRVEGPA